MVLVGLRFRWPVPASRQVSGVGLTVACAAFECTTCARSCCCCCLPGQPLGFASNIDGCVQIPIQDHPTALADVRTLGQAQFGFHTPHPLHSFKDGKNLPTRAVCDPDRPVLYSNCRRISPKAAAQS